MNDYGVGAVWMSEEKALEVSAIDESFYFLAAFRGRVFEHLKKIHVNLYGVHAVRQTLTTGGSLPRWDFPVYSLNLTGTCVCFTGLPLERREELRDKINYMNGIVSPALTEKVTHLVAESCDSSSKKYTEARRMGLPIMSPKWIEKAWEAAQKFSVENFSSKELVQQHRLPIFSQMVITATGIAGDERIDIARLVELNGGRFSGDMKRNECTHLIADQTKGTKYKKAREWGTIKIVRASWLRKSVEAGYVLPESAFDPEKRNRCSTPVLTSRAPEPPEDLDFSAIQGKGGRLDSSTFNTQISKHNEEPEPEPERTPLSLVRTSLRREGSRLRLAPSTPTVFDPIDQLGDTCLKGDFDFLEGCRIWLCGADQSRVDKWKKLLDRSGATRVGTMEAANHIVVLNASAGERTKLTQAKTRGVQVVRAEWIVACCKAKDLLGVEEYLWDPEDTVLRTASALPSHASDDVETPRVRKVVPISDGSTHVDYLVCDQVECGQLRLDGNYDQVVTVFFVKNCLLNGRMVRPSSHPLYRPMPAVEDSTVFLNTVIVVSCFNDYERLVLVDLIKRFGGRVQETLAKRNKGDQLAVTHVVGGSEGQRIVEARRQKFRVVDPSWVIECIINDKLLKEESFPLRGEAYASYEGRTDDLWPETARRRSLPQQTSAVDDFSDLIVDELRNESVASPSITRSAIVENEFRTPMTETMVGRILKEAVTKTAAPKHQARSDPTPTKSSEEALSSKQSIINRRTITRHSLRKSALNEKPLVTATELEPSRSEQQLASSRNSDMMALRAKMTERLEQRNREIASKLAANKASTAPASPQPAAGEDAALSRRRKRPQSGGNSGPIAKKTSQSPLPPTPTPEETPPPL
ncbi:BRCA1 protein, partial [Oesophagostomum dentatum]